MRYKTLSFIVILVVLSFIAFDSNQALRLQVLALSDKVKIWFFTIREESKLSYAKYIDQAHMIADNQKKLQEYEKLKLEFQTLQEAFSQLAHFRSEKGFYHHPNFTSVKAFSYVNFGSYNRVWLDFDTSSYPQNKIFGLVQNGYALGIAVIKNNRLMGLLNGDENTSYAVYIGEEKIPAIITYDNVNAQRIFADFIPTWLKVQVGDEVFTSGLDGIFVPDIRVGKISNIIQNYGYNTAEVTPYANNIKIDYMWLIDTRVPQSNLDYLEGDILGGEKTAKDKNEK